METPKVLDPEKSGQQEIAVAITLSVQIGEGRSLVMQTYMPRDAPVRDFHGVTDKLGRVVDRQKAHYDLQLVELQLAQNAKLLAQLKEDYVRISADIEAKWQQSGRRGSSVKLHPNEASQKSTAETNIKRFEQEITRLEAERDKLKAQVDGD